MFCANCGSRTTAGSAFCGECGQAVTEGPPLEQAVGAPESGPRLDKPVVIGGGIVLALVLAAAAAGLGGAGEESAEEEYDQVIAGDGFGNPAADEAMAEQGDDHPPALQANAGCSGFVDGSSRRDTLAGVALGDSFDRVAQQLRCGELAFELTEMNVTRGGNYRALEENKFIQYFEGRNGDERVEAKFIGQPGNQELVSFTRAASYKNSPPPSVDNLTASILKRYPKARMLGKSKGWVAFKNMGYGSGPNDELLSDDKIISCNSYLHQGDNCGFTFVGRVYPDTKNNPGLVREYSIVIYDRPDEESAEERARVRLQQVEQQRMDAEVAGSAEVRGL